MDAHRPRLVHVSDPRVRANSRAKVLCVSAETCGVEVIDLDLDRRRPERIPGAIRRALREHAPNGWLMSFRAHELWPAVKTFGGGRPILFDSLVSPSDSMISEQKLGTAGRLAGPAVRRLERRILRGCDSVITDTPEHTEFFATEFGLDRSKVDHVWVGAPILESQPEPRPKAADQPFTVLWYGSFTPQHGVDVLVDAAALLTDEPISFRFIGGTGKRLDTFLAHIDEAHATNVRHDRWIPFDDLVNDLIPNSDLCLGGPFGATPQGLRAITQKALQSFSQARPTVIGAGATARWFTDGESALITEQGSPHALADRIRWAFEHQHLLPAIGAAGQRDYEKTFGLDTTTEQMRVVLSRLGIV